MYPFLRMAFKLFRSRRQPAIGPLDTHISHHICWPWDIDPWCELNNGRTLTLYDLGRLPMARRSGLIRLLINNKWSITIAGASVRYRRRIRMFERIEMRSRVVGWDERFIYMEQSMWKRSGDCANHILLRNAVTSAEGIVPPDKVAQAFEFKGPPPGLPDWITAWTTAEAQRPWPPMQD
ncbi:MAG: thioesterase family protein [Rhodobacteraceae bacterium]|nr:thioesterase family protein [Paracoccaceae bacterium]